jgi:peptidoglycan/LPS O-acetylase OafA/YrhL/lysophospholipase L1-like esterase
MPRPARSDGRYVPGLDGIRAIAVIGVIAYHLGLSWMPGGMLGVGVFFTLSGYLITDLLLGHWRRHGELGLRDFWLRRARRLLPAVFLMLAAVTVYVALFDSSQLAAVRRQVLAASVYVSNWSTITQHGSYFARFAAPLPLDHLWSLAIEEQFYLLWPWLLLSGIWLVRRRGALVLVTLAGAAGSIVAMTLLYHPGYDPTRAYEGTDTRAFELLFGAALAVAWPTARAARTTHPPVRNALDAAGVVGLVGVVVLAWRTTPLSRFLYPQGFVLLSLATVALLAAVVVPSSRLGAALGWRPLRFIGVRSYGIYLWQWPIIVFLTPASGRIGLVRGVIAVLATVAIASLSWRYVEDPIRHGALGRLWRRFRAGARPPALHGGITFAALLLAVVGLTGALPAASAGHGSRPAAARISRLPRSRPVADRIRQAPSTRTACRSVVYIGDSTSEGSISHSYLPNPKQRLGPQLAAVGVRSTIPEISGARSIVETFEGHPNAATIAQQHKSEGFRGCWILALGTNEVDNVHDGSPVGFSARIDRMMSIAGGEPVMWVNAVSLLASPDAYANDAMQRWNRALLQACGRYPNMRVFDWADRARESWFISDGIHYTTPGYRQRTHLIAQALAEAFPDAGPPARCVVR